MQNVKTIVDDKKLLTVQWVDTDNTYVVTTFIKRNIVCYNEYN